MHLNKNLPPRSKSQGDAFLTTGSQNFHDTVEVQPNAANYGSSGYMGPGDQKTRPTVFDLNWEVRKHSQRVKHNKRGDDGTLELREEGFGGPNDGNQGTPASNSAPKSKKFGTFDGVLARCLLCIWGVIMYLRTGWIVANAGVWQTTLIMLLAVSVTTLTSLSLSAICTNGKVKAGGYYFLISRSLGPEFGGVIGILFALANCISVSLYLAGFAETVVSLYDDEFTGNYDIQLWGEITLTLLLLISCRGVG